MAEATPAQRRLLVAITGASGAVYGLRLLQVLSATPGVQIHAVVSDAGWLTLRHELNRAPDALRPLVHTLHDAAHLGAGPAVARSTARHGGRALLMPLAAIARPVGQPGHARGDVMLKGAAGWCWCRAKRRSTWRTCAT
jgi:4-hydroxy-3-polyprenylbenzoate decarboxylase